MKYNIFCDESDDKGDNYSNFYGGALIEEPYVMQVEDKVRKFREKHKHYREFKWSNINATSKKLYEDFVELIFLLINEFDIKIRIFFRHNSNKPSGLAQYHRRNKYFILYNQFLRYHFDLRFIRNKLERVQIYFDQIPNKQGDKLKDFKKRICKDFKEEDISFCDDDIRELSSSDNSMLQIVDVLLGSMQFKLNDKDQYRVDATKIPNQTKVKTEIYTLINENIKKLEPQEIYKNFNIEADTERKGSGKRLTLPWRHWNFKPN